eukprot:scaffold65872_cov18-Prasinocladus_malaysianus.AAC.1
MADSLTTERDADGTVYVRAHTGGLNIMPRQGQPPLKLVPPYVSTSAAAQLLDGREAGQGMLPAETSNTTRAFNCALHGDGYLWFTITNSVTFDYN